MRKFYFKNSCYFQSYIYKNIFDEEFIQLARSVYVTNDQRSEVKKIINIITNSGLVEEKSYKDYK